MKATLTTKGQITIPVEIRRRLNLEPGAILDFDETAPFLKARKVIDRKKWEAFGQKAGNPWPGLNSGEILDELRGPVELPPESENENRS